MIRTGEPNIGAEEIREVLKTLRANQLSWKSAPIRNFENAFARACGVRYAAAVNSGSSALLLAVLSLRLPPGSEVIVPDFGYIAAVNVVVHAGCTPVFVDVEEDTGNIDPAEIAKKITRRTRAIMCIHTYGHLCDMDRINALAKKHKLYVIEDAAEAHGARYRGRIAGSLGAVGCFSFAGNKVITTGEGGMIVTNDKKLYEEFAAAREQYHFKKNGLNFWHQKNGYGMYLSSMQAALGLAQLKKLDRFVNIKRRNAAFYSRELGRIIKTYGAAIHIAPEKKYERCSYWMYGIVVGSERERNQLMEYLAKKGIETRNYFPQIHSQPPFRRRGHFPQSERLARCGLYLPSGTGLTSGELKKVTDAIESFYKSRV